VKQDITLSAGTLPIAAFDKNVSNTSIRVAVSNYRWFALFIVWGAFLLSYIDRVAWSIIAAPVGASLGIQVTMLGAFVTAFYAGYVVANIVGGIITDFLGGRFVLTASMLLLGAFTFGFGHIQTLGMGIIVQFFMGLTAGADYSAGMKIIPTWFHRERGRAMGLYTTATSLAVVIANAIAPSFSIKYGWSQLFHMFGIITFVWGIITLLFLKNQPSGERVIRNTIGDLLSLLRNRNLIVLSIAGFGGMWATIGINAWSNALMTKGHGITPVAAGSIMVGFGIGAVIAKPVLGWVSDLPGVSRKWLSILTLGALVVLLVVFGYCSTTTQFYVVAPLLGVFAYGYLPILMAQISDTSGKRLAGAAAGWTNAIWQAGSVVSPLAIGYVYGQTHTVPSAFLVLAIGPAVAVLVIFLLKKSHRVE